MKETNLTFVIKVEVIISTRDEDFRFLRDENNKVKRFSSLDEVRKHLEGWKTGNGFYQPAIVYRVGKSLRDLTEVATYMTPFLKDEPVWKEIQ